ncbi:hypothetical protein V8B97DRAFT_1917679 [Scleroderma yunnanense]
MNQDNVDNVIAFKAALGTCLLLLGKKKLKVRVTSSDENADYFSSATVCKTLTQPISYHQQRGQSSTLQTGSFHGERPLPNLYLSVNKDINLPLLNQLISRSKTPAQPTTHYQQRSYLIWPIPLWKDGQLLNEEIYFHEHGDKTVHTPLMVPLSPPPP